MIRFRIKEAILVPVDATMTMVISHVSDETCLCQIHITHCQAGWKPTQHIFLRVLSGAGIFESHPFTITNAPSSKDKMGGITLYAKSSGDWTRKLHKLASDVKLDMGDLEETIAFLEKQKDGAMKHPGKRVLVTVDGPYGGLKLFLEDYERVLVVAGGSGITFALGTLEEAIRTSSQGSGVKSVEVIWAARDMSELLDMS